MNPHAKAAAIGVTVALAWYLLTRKSAAAPPTTGAVSLPPTSASPLPPLSEVVAPTKTLDKGLTVPEFEMVRHVLAQEANPKHLGGIASTFEPDYPITASLLRAKSAVMARRAMGSSRRQDISEAHAKRYSRVRDKVKPSEAPLTLVHLDPALRQVGKGDVPDWVTPQNKYLGAEVPAWRAWVVTRAKGPITKSTFDEAGFQGPLAVPASEESAHKIRCLVALFVKDGGLLRKTAEEIAKAYKVSLDEARFALASTRELTDDIRVATPLLRQLPAPKRPTKEALRLAATVLKPVHTKSITPEDTKVGIRKAKAIIHGASEGDPDAKKARQALGKAGKLIERRRWIQWYNRKRDL
jgi:hypothetical protein